jgi:hypothetical protein
MLLFIVQIATTRPVAWNRTLRRPSQWYTVTHHLYCTFILPTNTVHLYMSLDIIMIDEYFCDSPLLFYLLVQQKKLKPAAPVTKTH